VQILHIQNYSISRGNSNFFTRNEQKTIEIYGIANGKNQGGGERTHGLDFLSQAVGLIAGHALIAHPFCCHLFTFDATV